MDVVYELVKKKEAKEEEAMQVEMQSVQSSNISAVGYDEASESLHVHFRNSGTYVYQGIGKQVYEGFLSAPSKGKYFNAYVKPHKNYKKV